MKKLFILLLAMVLAVSACSGIVMGDEPAATENPELTQVSVSKKTVPCYMESLDTSFDLNLYFMDDATDLPYVDLREWADVMVTVYNVMVGAKGYELYVESDGPVFQYTRENGYTMLFDFQKGTIEFEDYDGFIHNPGDTSLIDMVALNSIEMDEKYPLLQRIEKGSFDRYGKAIEISLSDYNISMCRMAEENLYLVPLQTMRDLLLSLGVLCNALYNGNAVYLAYEDEILDGEGNLTALGESYYSASAGEMSEELALYSYCELCLALDHLYGLKESHSISSFDNMFTETGYKQLLCSTDPNVKDGALKDFIHYYLDDLHSGFKLVSYRTEEMESSDGKGISALRDRKAWSVYDSARSAADHAIPAYEEIGNTAYVTFDNFYYMGAPVDYYEGNISLTEDPSSETLDTIALIIYAHKQITRQDSPVENVVVDLSMNTGGAFDAAAFVAAWYLGEAQLNMRSSLSGATSTGTYQVDTNLDGVFDKNDTVADKNLYCLISPNSFSCGNLLPNIFKSSGDVILLGRESGGGSCSVLPMSTAYGSCFQISSPNHMAYVKNGSYYDTDTGIEPDSVILKPENFYDRQSLTDYINKLF